MKRIILTTGLVLFITVIESAQTSFIDWNELQTPVLTDAVFISGKSSENFRVFDGIGVLYEFEKGIWQTYPVDDNQRMNRIKIKEIPGGRILLTTIDSLWRSHVYIFDEGNWQKSEVLPNVVSVINVLNNGIIVLAGDWGSVVEYDGKEFKTIKTPFGKHIFCSVYDGNLLWYGVRGEGVYSFDGVEFEEYEIEGGSNVEIAALGINADNNVFFRTRNNTSYVFSDNKFIKSGRYEHPEPAVFNTGNFNYYKLNPAFLPFTDTQILVPAVFKYKEHYQFADGSIFLLTTDNRIFISETSGHNFFEDYALHFRIKGYENSTNTGAAFIYYNADILPDLLIKGSYSELRLNEAGAPFINYSANANLPINLGGTNSLINDLNNDGRTDIVQTVLTNDGPEVIISLQNDKGSFEESSTIKLNPLFSQRPVDEINIADFNYDGLPDLDLTFYLSNTMDAGGQLLLYNNGDGKFSEPDTTFKTLTHGYNFRSISADFNNDDKNDWLIVQGWKPLRLLIRTGEESLSFKQHLFKGDTLTLNIGGVAGDFNNDGSLDIALTTDKKLLTIFLNQNGEKFTEVESLMKSGRINEENYSRLVERSMNTGDFNNDGFLDIFMSLNDPKDPRNFLFINDGGKCFYETADEYKIKYPYAFGSAVADVDADGDLDIFGYRNGFNSLWINNINNDDYLTIIPRGVKTSTDAIGGKVEIYEAGYAEVPRKLIARRQILAEQFGSRQQNQIAAHFGLSDNKRYDVVVKFYRGEKVILRNVKAGQTIVVPELKGLNAYLYNLPRNLISFISKTDNQVYIAIILLSIAVLYFGANYGMSRFKWKTSTSFLIVIVDITFFWLLIFLTASSNHFLIKFLLPATVSIGAILLPLLVFMSLKKNRFYQLNIPELEEELLREIMQFTHGEWALRNISGLLFLLQNYPAEKEREEKYFKMLQERAATFENLTKPILLRIIELTKYLDIAAEESESLALKISRIEKIVHGQQSAKISMHTIDELKIIFQQVKSGLNEIKEIVFRKFSCEPTDIIKKITTEYSGEQVQINKYINYEENKYALIKTEDLSIVIDNLVQNALKAVTSSDDPKLSIYLNWQTPMYIIDVKDNGYGIEKTDWERIFESGYSMSGSTGKGLSLSRDILKKYNGRIYVKDSRTGTGTTIRVELNEGVL